MENQDKKNNGIFEKMKDALCAWDTESRKEYRAKLCWRK